MYSLEGFIILKGPEVEAKKHLVVVQILVARGGGGENQGKSQIRFFKYSKNTFLVFIYYVSNIKLILYL